MGQALYRKYRPRSFSEAIGQEAVTKTLSEAIKTGRISHAYLFAGPRGVGKTSIARILAHEVNKLPYQHDNIHLDIIEIDAASNRRIDEIRDLREKVHIAPTSAKYKVYIIDEVHMLTKEAFNALLKTLEEPPAHCIFILATTEAHKLPETIVSRTQRFNFKPIGPQATRKHLEKIAGSEKVDIDTNALALLAEYGDGSLRDIIGLLDQLSSTSKKITEEDVRNLLGIPPKQAIDQLAEHILNGEAHKALQNLDGLKEQGMNSVTVAKSLAQYLRQKLLDQNLSADWVIKLLKQLVEVSSSGQPQETLELSVLEAAAHSSRHTDKVVRLTDQTDNSRRVSEPKKETIKTERTKSVDVVKDEAIIKSIDSKTFNLDLWNDLLERVRSELPSLYTALRLAEPSIAEDKLVLSFPFQLHQKKVMEAKHISLIGRLLEDLGNTKMQIECVVDRELSIKRSGARASSNTEKIAKDNAKNDDSDLQTISNIFGSAEVLES
ncbi:MAG TPA: DNA polymerase III subunit gamma/tau [Candidatus Saccharimonadales bacterium]|nr:DNA polymerase III subunit gamma/tau [Candidatus Saccharimonadales bacterium]